MPSLKPRENGMNYEKVIELVKSTKAIIENETLKADVHMKGSADFVTAVDIAISNYLKKALFELYPDIGFFSEEEDGSLADRCWILDPIDGTTNLVYGYNMSSVSLGLHWDGQIIFGVVYNPFSEECFTAKLGEGAFMNGKRLFVSSRPLSESIIEFGAGSTRKGDADQSFDLGREIFKRCVDIRRICSSALDLCFIAAGRIDGYFETKLKPWDYAAGSLILSEAGGKTTNYDGEPIPMDVPSSIICSNGIIHDELCEIINKYR